MMGAAAVITGLVGSPLMGKAVAAKTQDSPKTKAKPAKAWEKKSK